MSFLSKDIPIGGWALRREAYGKDGVAEVSYKFHPKLILKAMKTLTVSQKICSIECFSTSLRFQGLQFQYRRYSFTTRCFTDEKSKLAYRR